MKQELQKFIKESNLPEKHRQTIKFLAESIEKDAINEFTSKTFLFDGDPGIGKTYFVENIITKFNLPILFLGPYKFNHKRSMQCKSLKELLENTIKKKEAIVFIDDLQNSLKIEYNNGEMVLADSERKLFLKLLEHIKNSNKRKFLFITLNDEDILEESWIDRIETRIGLDAPKEKSKKLFLSEKYSKFMKKSLIKDVAEKSIGYNFRNIDDLVKMAYREGNGIINRGSIQKAFSSYTPTSMERYHIIHKPNLNFKDVMGNEKLKGELFFLKQYIKHPRLFQKNGIERSNVMIFSGPPGTGKTYMAKALAGELEIPLVNFNAINFLSGGPVFGVFRIAKLARKFRNCVILVDELDKLIGQEILSEDKEVLGALESEIDVVREKTNAIMIFTMNNKARFGSAFHDRIPCFNFEYPNESERRIFLENKIKKSEISFSQEQINCLVRETENKSYRQIDKIWNNILFRLMDKEDTVIKNNKIMADSPALEESINETLGFLSNSKVNLTMFG